MTKDEILSHFHPKQTLINVVQAEFLYDNIIDMPDKGRALDVGTGMGDSALLFALTKPNWTIYTIDGYGMYGSISNVWNREGENSYKQGGPLQVLSKWNNANIKNIVQIVGNSWEIKWELMCDAIFIDADHSYDGVRKDVEQFSKFVKKDGFMGFHDYNYTYQVKDYIDDHLLDKWNLEEKEWTAILRKK